MRFNFHTVKKRRVMIFLFFLTFLNLINAQGPNSPEASGFEPVDATDMVNLTNGNLSYVLPLLEVDGFPVTLSYHAGMTMDMDASWTGLGWYLNPGAINRSVTNTPDDWKSGVGMNFNSFYDEVDYYGITVDVGLGEGASIGAGLNWGGGQGMSGSVSASFGIVEATISSTGDASVGLNTTVARIGPISASVGISYSLKNQWETSGSLKYAQTIDKKGSYISSSLSTNGFLSVGGGNLNSDRNSEGVDGGKVGMSSDSFSQGDASIDAQSTGISIPMHVIGIPVTLGFRKTKVKINVKKGYLNNEWGALYSSDYWNIASGNPRISSVQNSNGTNYDEFYSDYMVRTKSMDTYSTRLPQAEEEFVSDYSKTIENINFTFMGYDNYNIAAQGLIGNMTPHIFKNASIYGKGQITKDINGNPIHAFWHHGTSSASVNKKLGRIKSASSGTYNNTDLYFYFNGQFTSTEKNQINSVSSGNVNSSRYFDYLINEGNHLGTSMNNSYHGRAKSPNYIEVFTNRQIASGHAAARGLISPATIRNSDRNDIAKFDPDGIGAYKITAPDGKTYHFALPVYHYEQVQRGQINTQENISFDISNVNEKRQFTRYATHWLLTAITGSDYIDRPDPSSGNQLKTFNKEDYGYWVELEYGKWSDGYVWRTPYKDRVYVYSTNNKGEIEKEDKGSYSFGRKQLYYLDKINTKNRTALFVKELRGDAFGKELRFKYRNAGKTTLGNTGNGMYKTSLNYTNPNLYVRENGVHYKREYSLKLSRIILVDSKNGKQLSKGTIPTSSSNLASAYGRFGNTYLPNDTCRPNWESPYFRSEYGNNYSYRIHNESNVLDVRDIPKTFIQNHALKVVELNHSYTLAKNSPSSSEVYANNNTANGKLTLESVQFKGKGGADYMPATKFDYYMEGLQNLNPSNPRGSLSSISRTQIQNYVEQRKKSVDNWGFLQGAYQGKSKAMAWSLKEITMPTGAKIEIDYEEDDYWMEAFARRYWEKGLQIKFTQERGKKYVTFRNNVDDLIDDIIFTDYFNSGRKVFLDIQYHRNPSIGSQGRRVADFAGEFNIVSVTNSSLKIELPTETNSAARNRDQGTCGVYPWSYSSYFCGTRNIDVCDVTIYDPFGGNSCVWPRNGNSKFRFRLLANQIPINEMGGGLRVKELKTISEGNIYKVQYDYSHPFEGRSSGITSYAPIDGLKYVPYQSELPAPGVMYEYVTMKETSNTGSYVSKTRFRHHVLKPVLNIFDPNIEMEALDANAPTEDKIFWANVTENYGGFNGKNSRKITAKKIDVHVNTALIGQIKSVEKLNNQDHILMRTESQYINGTHLNGTGPNNEPNKGYTKETFNSMKSVFQTSDDGMRVEDVKRLLSISSRTDYNNMLKKTTTYAGGNSNSVEYKEVDPWLGSFRKSISTMADGTELLNYRVPAYSKYSQMKSKILNHSNRNMLTQEVMNISSIKEGSTWKTTHAGITTWNNNWNYRSETGSETSPTASNEKVWRKHKNFVWKDGVHPTTGTYNTTVTDRNTYFNWSTGTPTSNKWEQVSEITQYNHWSSPQEIKDINGNYASSKMADNWSKTVASGNAKYTEMYSSGAEFPVVNKNFLTKTEDEFTFINSKISSKAHTGKKAVLLLPGAKAFRITGSVGTDQRDLSKKFRPGKYKVSYWRYSPNIFMLRPLFIFPRGSVKLKVNGKEQKAVSKERAGDWELYNYIINMNGTTVDVYLDGNNSRNNIIDDFRLHPIYASINSYVYDEDTGELRYILDSNNLATEYRYDNAGRLCKVYKEVVHSGKTQSGFKLVSKTNYHYKGSKGKNDCGNCCGDN